MVYRIDNFVESKINPVTNCEYDDSWIIIELTDSMEYEKLVGKNNNSAYIVKISRLKCKNWFIDVGDFLGFYQNSDKSIIVAMSQNDYEIVKNRYGSHKYNDRFLRNNEPSVLVHSTSMENWKQIESDGMLKCWNRLKSENENFESSPIGMKLGDPADFSNYIMFGGGVTGEIVVNSRQKSQIVMDINDEYFTGARLYFDAEKIAKDGLLLRDGSHLKVKDTLLLKPYLIWVATWDVVGLHNQKSTPIIFAEKSDEVFRKIAHISI